MPHLDLQLVTQTTLEIWQAARAMISATSEEVEESQPSAAATAARRVRHEFPVRPSIYLQILTRR